MLDEVAGNVWGLFMDASIGLASGGLNGGFTEGFDR